MTTSRLREVTSEEVPSQPEPNHVAAQASMQLLLLALKTLSQRTVIALAALRGLALAGTVFWLAYTIMASPTPVKLTGLSIYAGFVLIFEFMGWRRK
jgi:hypothetical protein